MKLGIIARADQTGLGYQTRAYYKHLKPAKTMVVDISSLNGNKQYPEWYPDGMFVNGFPNRSDIGQFLRDLDVVLTAESPYNYELYSLARKQGIKTAVVYNYEFFDWFKYPEYPLPDLLIAPSMWNYNVVDLFAKKWGVQHTYIHHPVDREEFKYRLRVEPTFMHIAGKPAAYDRNGTFDYLEAHPTGRVITQSAELSNRIRRQYRYCRVIENVTEPRHLYELGNVLVFPRRYGGNCLPLNEALSCGMPVIMPDISPNNVLLPHEWLVPAQVIEHFEPRTLIDIYKVDIQALSDKIEWFKNCDMIAESRRANEIADSISWDTLRQMIIDRLEAL